MKGQSKIKLPPKKRGNKKTIDTLKGKKHQKILLRDEDTGSCYDGNYFTMTTI